MPKIAYTGLSHFRKISKKDFADNDIDQAGIEVARGDLLRVDNPKKIPNVVEVSDEAAEFLLEVEPKDWKVVKDDEEVPANSAGAQEVSDPQPETANVLDNPALGDTQPAADSAPTVTGGSSTTPAARGGRR